MRADIISADFKEVLSYYYTEKILEADGQPLGPGFEPDEGDLTSNPYGLVGSLQVDLTSSLLSFQPTRSANFQTITITISNIVFSQPGEAITDFSLLTNNAVTGDFTTSVSFTDDSLTVIYTPLDSQLYLGDSSSTSTFSVTAAAPSVPDSGNTGLLLFGSLSALAALAWLKPGLGRHLVAPRSVTLTAS